MDNRKVKELAEKHWDDYIEPLLYKFARMHKVKVYKEEMEFHRYNFLTSAIHFAKHEREDK